MRGLQNNKRIQMSGGKEIQELGEEKNSKKKRDRKWKNKME